MIVRAMAAKDLADVLALQCRCEQAPQWSEAVWRKLLEEDTGLRCLLVAEAENGLSGYVVTSGAAGRAEMETVAVDPAAQGRGTGRALCREALRWAAARGAITMELEVRASNIAARSLYVSLGFVEEGIRRAYYAKPVEDGVLMSTVLTGRDI